VLEVRVSHSEFCKFLTYQSIHLSWFWWWQRDEYGQSSQKNRSTPQWAAAWNPMHQDNHKPKQSYLMFYDSSLDQSDLSQCKATYALEYCQNFLEDVVLKDIIHPSLLHLANVSTNASQTAHGKPSAPLQICLTRPTSTQYQVWTL
jgi:hypothetical protein